MEKNNRDTLLILHLEFRALFPCHKSGWYSGRSIRLPMRETWVQSLDQTDSWRRKWQHTATFLPGKSRGQRSPMAMVHRVAKKSDTTGRLSTWMLVSNYQNWASFQEPLNCGLLSEVRVDPTWTAPSNCAINARYEIDKLTPNSVCETHWSHPGEASLG